MTTTIGSGADTVAITTTTNPRADDALTVDPKAHHAAAATTEVEATALANTAQT